MASEKNNKPTFSRLIVDEQFRIWLPDYNNIEILLTPLPKTLYFFILKQADGIRLKELPAFRKELLQIYSKIGNRLNLDQMKKSINDLTDMRSNSVHEKCSRIREAFTTKIKNGTADQYYISGTRNQPKRILLQQTFIILPNNL
jgi:hypothetical protein